MIDYKLNLIAITLACPVGSSDPATLSATHLAREWSAHLQVYRCGPAYVTGRKCLISYFEGISVSTAVRRADAAAAALALMFEESEAAAAESISYAKFHGNHQFTEKNRDEICAFVAVMILSGYTSLPRWHMYWEQAADCHNQVTTILMIRNRLERHVVHVLGGGQSAE